MVGRKRPRSGGHRRGAAEDVLQRGDTYAVGMAPLLRLFELLRIAEQHQAPGRADTARVFASDIWPASSTKSTSTVRSRIVARPEPGGAAQNVDLA